MQRKVFLFASLCLVSSLWAGDKKVNFHSLQSKNIQGKEVAFSQYKGKVVLAVNVASKCGYTPQYEGLEKLYQQYKSKGLVIIGFPSNDFGGQEPGTEKEIADFCKLNYGVTFDLMKKLKVTGDSKDPVYQFLTESSPKKGEVKWNFEKFLVDKEGNIKGRFESSVKPESNELKAAIESLL
ncbi:glutathione peroxidase [Leptospira ryugenii]|uniref:glutathione peroxidase n=1 Tax=Leptospira ryugenii TaxID=1917863 RepID=UPI003F75CB99